MTAEIAIMNKEAVVMAADSAVTLGGGQKVVNSANKIFALSRREPVGIMVYNSACLMDVPWETIIKAYRDQLGVKSFATLEEYATDFCRFVARSRQFTPISRQKAHVEAFIHGFLQGYLLPLVKELLKQQTQPVIQSKGNVTQNEVKRFSSKIFRQLHEKWKKAPYVTSANARKQNALRLRYRMIIQKVVREVLRNEGYLNYSQVRKFVFDIALMLLVKTPKGFRNPQRTGVVIAGFGRSDVFPSLVTVEAELVAGDYLKYQRLEETSSSVEWESSGVVVPFAQTEMARVFMEGVDPRYEKELETYVEKLLSDYPSTIVNSIQSLSAKRKKRLLGQLRTIGTQQSLDFEKKMAEYRQEQFWGPIVRIVGSLPKVELAGMAESLVHLVSLKRKVTSEKETVGGPIDVAIISKGDGFIWIKRKHYFDPHFNHHFLAKVYGECSS